MISSKKLYFGNSYATPPFDTKNLGNLIKKKEVNISKNKKNWRLIDLFIKLVVEEVKREVRQTDTNTDRQTNRHKDKQTDRHKDRQTNRHKDKQTDRHKDKQTDRLLIIFSK